MCQWKYSASILIATNLEKFHCFVHWSPVHDCQLISSNDVIHSVCIVVDKYWERIGVRFEMLVEKLPLTFEYKKHWIVQFETISMKIILLEPPEKNLYIDPKSVSFGFLYKLKVNKVFVIMIQTLSRYLTSKSSKNISWRFSVNFIGIFTVFRSVRVSSAH